MKLTPNLLDNFELADIVRGSADDFNNLFKKRDADSVYRSQIMFYTKKFIYTDGSNPIELRADGALSKQYPVEPVKTVSTIGAGDNFNAGLLYGIIAGNITRTQIDAGLSEDEWDSLIGYAQAFSRQVCTSLDNYVSTQFGAAMKAKLLGMELPLPKF